MLFSKLTGISGSKEPTQDSEKKMNAETPLSASMGTPIKPIRKNFKTPQGPYHLLKEVAHQTAKWKAKMAKERHQQGIVRPTRISVIDSLNSTEEGTKEVDKFLCGVNSGDGLFIFSHVEGESLPLLDSNNKDLPEESRTQSVNPSSNSSNSFSKYYEPNLRFRVIPNCHNFNKATHSSQKLEFILGFTSGDIILHDVVQKNNLQFNKDKCISTGSVNAVEWIPGSQDLFIAAFSTGNLFIFDKTREDDTFTAVINDQTSFSVYIPEGKSKYNPVARWHISSSAVNDISFSSDGKHLAVACQDGYLRIFDFKEERLLLSFRSYYGGFLCVTWSPDNEFILTGGEDDLVSLWSFAERRLLLRGRGHQSWVSRVAFDPYHCSNGNYIFASVSQDTRLILWEFSKTSIPKPRSKMAKRRDSDLRSSKDLISIKKDPEFLDIPLVIPAVLNNDVGFLDPIAIHRASTEPLSDVNFLRHTIITTCWGGITKFWSKSQENV